MSGASETSGEQDYSRFFIYSVRVLFFTNKIRELTLTGVILQTKLILQILTCYIYSHALSVTAPKHVFDYVFGSFSVEVVFFSGLQQREGFWTACGLRISRLPFLKTSPRCCLKDFKTRSRRTNSENKKDKEERDRRGHIQGLELNPLTLLSVFLFLLPWAFLSPPFTPLLIILLTHSMFPHPTLSFHSVHVSSL